MNEMPVRIARVLFLWQYCHDRWDDAEPEEREDCIEAARAVIYAIRVPTEEMIVRGGNAADWDHRAITDEEFEAAQRKGATAVWQAMIDDAKK